MPAVIGKTARKTRSRLELAGTVKTPDQSSVAPAIAGSAIAAPPQLALPATKAGVAGELGSVSTRRSRLVEAAPLFVTRSV